MICRVILPPSREFDWFHTKNRSGPSKVDREHFISGVERIQEESLVFPNRTQTKWKDYMVHGRRNFLTQDRHEYIIAHTCRLFCKIDRIYSEKQINICVNIKLKLFVFKQMNTEKAILTTLFIVGGVNSYKKLYYVLI